MSHRLPDEPIDICGKGQNAVDAAARAFSVNATRALDI